MPGQTTRYVAFLRGINVGGHGVVKMADVKRVLETLKFKSVKTILASGNVLFETASSELMSLTRKIEKQLKQELDRDIGVVLRTVEYLEEIAESQPFKAVKVTPATRLYVTLMREKTESRLKIPYTSPDKELQILRVTEGEIFSVVTLRAEGQTGTAMNIIEKEFGKQVTTRNWNTIDKIIKAKT